MTTIPITTDVDDLVTCNRRQARRLAVLAVIVVLEAVAILLLGAALAGVGR